MQSQPQYEIEVKFYVDSPAVMRQRIIDLGATLAEDRCFELNHRYDDAQDVLKRNFRLLRLRKSHKTTLTYKHRRDDFENQFKVHQELEVEVDDFETMQAILAALGYRKVQVYEKWRETYRLAETAYCLDTMPYGDFLEIEGSKADILQSAALLGLNWENRILLNYIEIFEKIKYKHHLAFNDITFDNFNDIDVDLRSIILANTAR